jgi:hypothetical protein
MRGRVALFILGQGVGPLRLSASFEIPPHLRQRRENNSGYLIPGMNPLIPRIIFARPPFCIRFIISRICSN